MKPTADSRNWKRRLLAEIARDKKKTTILGVLSLVALVLVARVAVTNFAPVPAQGAGTSSDPLRPAAIGPARAAADTAVPKKKKKAVRPDPGEVLSYRVTKNLFAPNPLYFPPEELREPAPAAVATTAPATRPAAENPELVVRAQARALELQSTIASASPTAIINGRVQRVGDVLAGFRVVEIRSSSCVVEKDGVQVILTMQDNSSRGAGGHED